MSRLDRVLPWVLRAAWVAIILIGGEAIDDATLDRSDAVAQTATWAAFAGWTVTFAAMAIPGVVTLTAVRLMVPLAAVTAVWTLVGGATGPAGWGFVAVSGLAVVVAHSAELGHAYVQASAYGEEDRHLLRPPAAYLLAAVLTWVVWAAATVAAPVLLADGRWVTGIVAGAVAVGGGVLGWPRWHRLSRRWFVVVPIGLVVHDHLVLAETVMLRRQEIANLRLAPAGTEAADLTGPASGHALEVSTNESTTVIYAATPKQPQGTAIHLTAALVAPTRPGQALAAAAARRLPVG